ncbi:MAG: invasion associated locus B family protein [Rhizomicrobium sp.]
MAILFLGALWALAVYYPHPAPAGLKPGDLLKAADQIQAGFIGQRRLGPWELSCSASETKSGGAPAGTAPNGQAGAEAPVPFNMGSDGAVALPAPTATGQVAGGGTNPALPAASPASTSPAGPAPAAKPATKPVSLGRCRVTHAFRAKKNPQQTVMVVSFRFVGDNKTLVMIVRLPPLVKQGQSIVVALGNKKGFKLPVRGCTPKSGCVAMGAVQNQVQAVLFAAKQAEIVLPAGADGKRGAVRLPLAGLSAAVTAMRRAESEG